MVLIGGWLSVKPKEQAHAIAPLVAWGLWTAGGVVADIALEQGIKWATKTAGKKAADKVTKKVLDNADDFDFTKEAPKKTKDGELYVPVSSLDKQKIATLWKEEATTVIEADINRKQKYSKPKYDLEFSANDPMYSTSISLDVVPDFADWTGSKQMHAMIQGTYDVVFTPIPYGMKTNVTLVSVIDGSTVNLGDAKGGSSGNPTNYKIRVAGGNTGFTKDNLATKKDTTFYFEPSLDGRSYRDLPVSLNNLKYFYGYLQALANANRTIYLANGLVVPGDAQRIYEVPMNTPSGYDTGVSKKPSAGFKIPLPDSYKDGNEYELTENNYQEFETIYNDYVTNNLEQELDYSTNNYDYSTTTINNYYTYEEDEDEKSIEDVKNDITIIIENNNQDNNENGGSGNLPSGEETNKFYQLMANTGQKITDMYNGVVKFFEVATTGFSSLTSGMGGFMKFLDEFFDWLPDEYRALLGAGFTLGVVSFFLRR